MRQNMWSYMLYATGKAARGPENFFNDPEGNKPKHAQG